jgi:hypothetical protein
VVHRNLFDLADDDRVPADTTVNLGSAAVVPGVGWGCGPGKFFLSLDQYLDAAAADRRAHSQCLRCG